MNFIEAVQIFDDYIQSNNYDWIYLECYSNRTNARYTLKNRFLTVHFFYEVEVLFFEVVSSLNRLAEQEHTVIKFPLEITKEEFLKVLKVFI